MSEELKPNQFEVAAERWIPGQELLTMFGFDPDKCVIEVDKGGVLCISQEGFNCFHACAPGFWRRV